MVMQPCPACGAHNDVSIYVSGQKKPCSGCGLTFEVRRSEQTGGAPAEVEARPRPVRATRAQPPVAPQRRPVAKVVEAGAQKPAAQEPPRPAAPADRGKAAEPAPRAPQAAKTDQGAAGLEIPGFDLHEVIGKGGMGKVYRAVQHSLHREVAIKVLNEDLAKHPSFIKRFEKEAHSLAALQHPNIATIHDTSHVGPHYFLVMEYIGGLSLRHMLNQGRLPLDQIGELFGKLCRAVDHAHRNRVIHRDLKPENVLFTQGGVLKVVDFGLANILDQNGQWELTRTKVSMGTVNYMAPEQRKDAKHVDHRADIYSLGVMLYEMLTGELPLGRFEDPSRHRAGVPADLDRLVARMLDFEPDRRPQSAELVAATLERLASRAEGAVAVGRALPAPAPSDAQAAGVAPPAALPAAGPPAPPAAAVPQPGPRRAPRRRRRLSAALVFLLGGAALLALAAVFFFWLLLGPSLADSPGDVILLDGEGNSPLALDHPHVTSPLPTAERRARGGLNVLRYDFKPSELPTTEVVFLGGSWQVENAALVQDTSRRALTVNKVPARALFGERPMKHEGLSLLARVRIEPAQWTQAGVSRLALDVVRERFLGAGSLLPVDLEQRVGLGFLDERGEAGLQLLLPLASGRDGLAWRRGPLDGSAEERFDFPGNLEDGQTHSLRLQMKDDRARLSLDGRDLFEGRAGFPLGFRGLPAVLCQNARCTLSEVEITTPAGVD